MTGTALRSRISHGGLLPRFRLLRSSCPSTWTTLRDRQLARRLVGLWGESTGNLSLRYPRCTRVGKCPVLGDFEHHFQVFVGDSLRAAAPTADPGKKRTRCFCQIADMEV